VENPNCVAVMFQYFGQALVGLGRFVGSRPAQRCANSLDRVQHLFAVDLPCLYLNFAPFPIADSAGRLSARHQATGTMDRRKESHPAFLAFHALQNDRDIPHRAADESLLPRESRCCPLAGDPQ